MDLPPWVQALAGMALAAVLAYVTTPVAIQAARRLAFYDVPRGYKAHAGPTPYLGGTAVIAAFAFALLVSARNLSHTAPLVCGVLILLALGTVDDRRTVRPSVRVAVEFAIGALLAADGLGWSLGAGATVNAAVTGAWVVAVINAFNLFDNMDGQASTMAAAVSAGAAALALIFGDAWVAAGSAALCGACLGFLPHNLSSPARIFLGDGGSMPVGLAVAVLVAAAAHAAERSSLSLLVGFLLVAIPALDSTLVVVSRARRHVSIFTGGRDHLTHRARQRLRTPRRVALALGSVQAIVSGLVILATRTSGALVVYIALTFVVCGAAAIVALEEVIADPGRAGGVRARAGGARGQGDGVRRRERSSFLAQEWRGRRRSTWTIEFCLVILGLGAGASPFLSGYYTVGVWVPLGLVLVVAAAVALVARPPTPTRPVVLAFAGVAGLGLWSMLSMAWGDSAELAGVDANLWLSYAALLLLLVTLIGSGGSGSTAVIAAGAGIAIVAVTLLIQLLGGNPASLFGAGRLSSPLGYINGEGCVFAMAVWLAVALAEHRRALIAALGAGAAVVFVELALMTQSRGAAIATLVTVVVALALAPGFRRRAVALAVIGAGSAAAVSPVVHVYTVGSRQALPASTAHSAAVAIIVAAVVVAIVWGAIVALGNTVARRDQASRQLARRAATVAACFAVGAPLVAATVRFSSIEHTVRDQWHAFVHVSGAGTAGNVPVRLLSGAGDRYDFWRVAWLTFTSHPIAGIGAGNYPVSYYEHRKTQESIENPHSIELQMLSELGIVGLALLALFVAGFVAGANRLRRVARASPGARATLVAAGGATLAWFIDTSGDWMHVIPGVTAIAFCGVAALCDPTIAIPGARSAVPIRRLATLVAGAVATVVLAIGGASLLRAAIARHYLDRARAELAGSPQRAIDDSRRVLRIDGDNLDAYYIEAAGEARFDRAEVAREILLEAVRAAPDQFVTWTLLGDLETRAGRVSAARAYYRRALQLDPRDPSLAMLAQHPRRGLLGRS